MLGFNSVNLAKTLFSIIVAVLVTIPLATGECIYSEEVYMNQTVWQPDPCTVCSCQDPIAVCEQVRCTNPRCDFHRGEYLRIPANMCCPECVRSLSPCKYRGQTVDHNTDWSPESCVDCYCYDGEVACSNVTCPQQRCKPGEISQSLPGQCCPTCIPSGRSCSWRQERHQDGSEWEPLPCTKCVCRDGQATCYPIQCPPINCPAGMQPERGAGSCCPLCTGAQCQDDGNKYKDGTQWERDSCTICVCLAGKVVCTRKQCESLSCDQNERKILRDGRCCEECIPSEVWCGGEQPVRYSGDLWNISSCDYCGCYEGRVSCHTAHCDHIQCGKNEVLVHKDGQCCPECLIPPQCQFAHSTYQDGDTWHPDPCSVCNCLSGEVTCYQKVCSPCPEKMFPVTMPGECCGQCRSVECGPACSQCLPTDPAFCTKCQGVGKRVEEGRCIDRCSTGFYPDGRQTCQACDGSCQTCTADSRYHCMSCSPGLLWQEGQCLPHCDSGNFIQNGQCLACDHSCKTCSGPGRSWCLSCANPAQLISRGECKDDCGEHFYVSHGVCQACSGACEKCLPDRSECVICSPGALLYKGQCLPSCPSGFYPGLDGACRACYPSCQMCSGGSEKDCTSCHGGASLRDGRCRMPCPPGQYLRMDGNCQNCVEGCRYCHVTPSGGQTMCMMCSHQEQVPWGGGCRDDCGLRSYLDNAICRDCSKGCMTCDGPVNCLRCEAPMVLYHNQCVRYCGQGKYSDQRTGTCQDCSSHCVKCTSADTCQSCDGQTYLEAGHCINECSLGYFTDGRNCTANRIAPVLQVTGEISVPLGGSASMSPHNLYITDSDTPLEKLKIYLINTPANGQLMKNVRGKDVVLGVEDTFTLKDLREDRIRFVHESSHDMKGKVHLQVSDGQLFSDTEVMMVQVLSQNPLSILIHSPFMAKVGIDTLITHAILDVMDSPNSQTVTITVLEGPQHGKLIHKTHNAVVTQFPLQELKGGNILYRHDDTSPASSDMMVLQITDGYQVVNVILQAELRDKDSKIPILTANNVAFVYEKGMVQITADQLKAESVEVTDNSKTDLVYTLVPSSPGNPKEGEILMVVPEPPGGVTQGWKVIEEGQMAAQVFRFLQRDINEGRIWYQHKTTASEKVDIFRFEVSDMSVPPNILKDQLFHISILQDPVAAMDATITEPDSYFEMTVLQSEKTVLSAEVFPYEHSASDPREIVYRITVPLDRDQGTVEHVANPFEMVYRFTQLDVNNNKIIYRPPIKELGSHAREVAFSFVVSDKVAGVREPEQKFVIRVVPVNNMAPRFRKAHPQITVPQAGYVPVGRNVLQVTDTDTDVSKLELTIQELPLIGVLIKNDQGLKLQLQLGDLLSYEEVMNNVMYYSHDGSDGPLLDSFQVLVTDGAHEAYCTVSVRIISVDKSAPSSVPSASQRILLPEGESLVLKRDFMAFADDDDNDDQVMITLGSEPTYGSLYLKGKREAIRVGIGFTQDDINKGRISYKADHEIGDRPLTEAVYFNVSDSSNNVLPYQVLSITITPSNNQPPVVTVGHGLQVEESKQEKLTSHDISVTDIDSPVSELSIILDTPPTFGVIQNSKPLFGSEHARRRIVTSFLVQDLLDGHIYYIQSDHKNKEPAWDNFLFHATDSVNQSPTERFNISIIAINDEHPLIVTEQLFVQEGKSVSMTNATFYVIDIDTSSDELFFTLESPPSHGTLARKEFIQDPAVSAASLRKGAQFIYEDVLRELIVYIHDGGEVTTDSFSLSLTDGAFTDTKTISVIIGLVNDETPRLVVNHGLRMPAGSIHAIKSLDLRATDVDSEDDDIIYTLSQNPTAGELRLNKKGRTSGLFANGPKTSFTQADIDKGYLEYVHERGDKAGSVIFKFQLSDPEGNSLIDQSFYITVLEDQIPPTIDTNKELIVSEGSQSKITTQYLSASDQDSEPGNLLYTVLSRPLYGHLELIARPGVPVGEFVQSNLAANSLIYVHTSTEEIYQDRFTFSVSDGTNEVTQSFYVMITPVDDSLPVVTVKGLRVQEGVRKVITEFDLKAEDNDTKEDLIIFVVVEPPLHGSLELKRGKFHSVSTRFSMADIYENRVSYKHDGSETTSDRFSFTVSDGTNHLFIMQQDQRQRGDIPVPIQSKPQDVNIEVLPVDDGSPILETNLGLQFLESSGEEIFNVITERELKVLDVDTHPDKILFVITSPPQHGRLLNMVDPLNALTSFTQDDISQGLVRYHMTSSSKVTMDTFKFDVLDSKPNTIPDNVFHISWSVIEFGQPHLNVSEETGIVKVPVVRRGNLKQYSIITCRTLTGTATSTRSGRKPGLYDFVEHTGQVQFDEWQDVKPCTIIINDDHVFEGPETLYLELSDPTYALLGDLAKTSITVFDLEDEPIVQFDSGLYQVNESDGYVLATLTREGDLSRSISVICYTQSLTATGSSLGGLESGSDYQSRGKTNSYRVVFPPGVVTSSCEVKLVDDSEFENSEQFELGLMDPSLTAAIGPMSKTTVIIEGPNDESIVFLSQSEYHFGENAGNVEVEVLREGSDLSHSTMVWCATRLSDHPSATPGQDYVPSSSQITFGPGQVAEKCQLTILDDDMDPRLEGNETFVVFLSSAMGSSLAKPLSSTVTIHDNHLDIPTMEFGGERYFVDELNKISVPIVRRGDLSYESSVICYTRQDTATVMMDYEERVLSEASRIIFFPGEMVKNCTVGIVDDGEFEPEETFSLVLGEPRGTEYCEASLGARNKTSIVITDYNDIPTIQLEKAAYSVIEPSTQEMLSTVVVKVVRTGDINQTSSVRCSTRDGSALSGIDYNPKSLLLKFAPGVRAIDFPVDVLYNREIEWHESFSVILGSSSAEGAILGPVRASTITVLDNEVSGSLVLPAAPIVVSLLHYDELEKGQKLQPSPGYPLVCVTPCDVHYPEYTTTFALCEEAGVNQTHMYYRWEVSTPGEQDGSQPPFVTISDNTLFTSVNRLILDSIYFRPSFKIRCVAQPLHKNGNPGVPLKSNVVIIGRDNAVCPSTVFSGKPYGYQAQSFIANLDYVGPEDEIHPNTIHISVQVPHQDGMLPLVSTFPLHNLRFLLSDLIYRQQHVCSNIITAEERAPLIDEGFLSSLDNFELLHGPGYNLPYQFDKKIRENKTLNLYKHLDLKSCIWTFNAWYHMTELVDICGGKVISDFQVRDSAQTYLTVRLPLYVSYLYATAPTGWGSLEHRTEIEISFFYNTILWRTGLETDGKLGGKLQVLRILIGEDGKLVVDFKTQAKYRGLYVSEHHTLPGFMSRVLPPAGMDISFDLDLLWSQQTFDSPQQLWRATSNYNLKDYTGQYTIELIPCTVKPTQSYMEVQLAIPCTAHQPERFEVPMAFQQTNRPVPVVYSLNTEFQLTNNENMFLLDPQETKLTLDDLDYSGAFSKGQNIFGRVLWSPEQDLKTAYKLVIEKVYLCTGRDGYVPTFDPTGEIYKEGPQFGCIQPHPNLKYRFLILDRENPDVAQTDFNSVEFGAQLAGENPDYVVLETMSGVDGFVMSVDPLYKVDSGHQWYLQCLYTIGPADRATRIRRSAPIKRSAFLSKRWRRDVDKSEPSMKWFEANKAKNGTNMQILRLNESSFDQIVSDETVNMISVVAPAVGAALAAALIICLCCVCCCRRRRKSQKYEQKKSNLEIAQQNPVHLENKRNSYRERFQSLPELDIKNVIDSPCNRRHSVRVKNINVRVSISSEAQENGTEV